MSSDTLPSDRPLDGSAAHQPGDTAPAPSEHDTAPGHQTRPAASPWWTAPAGKPVEIPAFGRDLFDTLISLFFPAPRPIPLRVKSR